MLSRDVFLEHCIYSTDNEAPYFTSCPEDKLVITTGQSERVQWVIPEFLDNSNRTPLVENNKNPGAHFYIGEVFVFYVARDQSGNFNDSCAFKVHVKGKRVDAYFRNSIWCLA